jgi:SAM-dependent methyltransferase
MRLAAVGRATHSAGSGAIWTGSYHPLAMTTRRDSARRGHLLPGLSYFEYQRLVCRDVVLPWLEPRMPLAGVRVLDIGAHHGGMVDYLREEGTVGSAVALELSAEVAASSPFVPDERFRLEAGDVLDLPEDTPPFDLVLLHDVLEHIPARDRALASIRETLSSATGRVFVSFPPYYSGFGGHQQYARGVARAIPFVHLLPARLFYRVAAPGEQEYMTAEGALEDLVSVRRTRLTLASAEAAFARAGFGVDARELFLVRPEYTVRYGLNARGAGILGRLPGLREVAVNGAFYLLRPAG